MLMLIKTAWVIALAASATAVVIAAAHGFAILHTRDLALRHRKATAAARVHAGQPWNGTITPPPNTPSRSG